MFIILVLYNPLQNGDFEQWSYINSTIPFAWDTVTGSGSSCEWTPATISRSGNYSIRIRVVNDAGGYDCAIAQSKVVSENTDYTVRFWVLDTSQTAYAKVYVRCYRSDGSFISGSFAGDSSINIPSWQVVGGIYTTPSECYYMDAQLRVYDTGTVYVDVGNLNVGAYTTQELVESFDYFPPSGWIEVDPGTDGSGTKTGFLHRRTSACPFAGGGDNVCFGIKVNQSDDDYPIADVAYLITDTMDFISPQPETLIFFWKTNSTSTSLNPGDSVNVEISIDVGNTWSRIWQWSGNPSVSMVAETLALDAFNFESQVLIRFAYYKNSTVQSSQNGFFNIDSVKVLHSYVGRYNRFTNASFELWLYDTVDMMPDNWERKNNRAPYSNIAQLWIMRDSENVFSGNYSLKAFFTTTQNPFIEQTIANPFTDGCAGRLVSDIDSYSVHISTRLYDNDPNGKVRPGVVWYSGSSAVQTTYTSNYTVNSTAWQLFEIYDTLSTGPSQGDPVDSINFRIRFYNEGSFPDAESGATVYADSVNLTWYCFVDDVTPVDVAEMYPMNPLVEYIRHYGNRLQVSLRKPAVVEIYDVRGRLVSRKEVKDRAWFQPGRGVFIVRIGDFRKKVVLY